jgi:Fur family ferric uptake transcriptional regulator
MTSSWDRPHSPAATPSAAISALRANGLRVSAARRLVLEALYAADGPVSADDIAGGLNGLLPPSNLSSIYRNLDTLEQVGLVERVHLGRGPGRYAACGLDRGWAACECCQRRVVLEPQVLETLRAAVQRLTGFDARFSHFPIVGRCRDCLAEDTAARRQL